MRRSWMFSLLLKVEGARGLDHPRAEQGSSTATAVGHGLEGNRAGRTAGRPAIDAAEIIERLSYRVRAATARHHSLPGES